MQIATKARNAIYEFFKWPRVVQITHHYSRLKDTIYAVETTMTDAELKNILWYLGCIWEDFPAELIFHESLCENDAVDILHEFYGCKRLFCAPDLFPTWSITSIIDLYEIEAFMERPSIETMSRRYGRECLRDIMLHQITRRFSRHQDSPDVQRCLEPLLAFRAGTPIKSSWGLTDMEGTPYTGYAIK